MSHQNRWISIKISTALKQEINKFCDNEKNGFANASQYIHHVLKTDLDSRKRIMKCR